MKTKLTLLILCSIAQMAAAQDHFLHVGDRVPEAAYTASHYPGGKIRLSQLNKKLIILDLWDIYCGGCIEHMPEIAALQKRFDKDIQIIMVSKSKSDAIGKLAARSEFVRENPLPFINGEEKLAWLFNYKSLPTHVWLDGTGKVLSITDDDFTKAGNIAAYLAGKLEVNIEKKPVRLRFDHSPLILQTYPLMGDNFYITSYLAPIDHSHLMMNGAELSGLANPGPVKTQNGTETFKALYKTAYGWSPQKPLSDSRVLLEFHDTAGYSQQSYFYNLIVRRPMPEEKVRKYVALQFDLTFGVSSSLEKRKTTCLVIKQLPKGLSVLETTVDSNRFQKTKDQGLRASLNWKSFLYYLGALRETRWSLIDETSIPPEKIVTLEMNMDYENMDKIQRSLAPYGLTIVKEERMLECIVIQDAKN